MRFLYEETAAGIRILRSFGGNPSVVLPEMVEGKPVTELGSYAFSDHIDQKDLEKAIETGRFCREDGETADGTDENLSVSGEKVSEVFLPETLKKIGRYAFYNCRKLKKIALGGTCMDVGAGAFTGCHQVEEIRITVQSDGTSALREILTELPETIRVDWKKEGLKGVFWFPEFFEEGVENTPARILENHIHGSGLRYRNCFARNSLNIREYDELFPYAKAWEEEGVVLKMALGRLLFPVELGEKAEEHYPVSYTHLNSRYQEKLINKILFHYGRKFLLPAPIRACYTTVMSAKYIWKGVKTLWRRKIEVPVLDATAIGVSVFRGDINTAASIMFLLGIGELLEEWTHKKSVGDLARTMSLNVGSVWLKQADGQEVQISANDVKLDDQLVIHMGTVIPFDGTVVAGEAMVNQASLTGESVAVRRAEGSSVYAGTVVEEGELTIQVKSVGGSSRYDKIVTMIEESEKLKSGVESKAEHLADRLVPYSLGGTALTYLLTRNATKALSILMVDFSCALKLAMPISVLSAIRQASTHKITVKGGKYMEAVSEASTIVFDKTGTLTKARPTVAKVVSFCEKSEDELLRIAACLEEHFPHSMAKAVVNAAKEKNL